jgi:polyisoprenoid-binding protein YceI
MHRFEGEIDMSTKVT